MRRFVLPVVALVAAGVLGGVTGAAVWEATDDDGGTTQAVTTVATPTAPVASRTGSVAAVYKAAVPSVVEVAADSAQGSATGSGWVFDNDGHVVTNQHVVEGAQVVSVRFHDGKEVEARVVGEDASSDVALLELSSGATVAPALPVGSSSSLQIGDPLIAIGSPFGLQGTLTTGVVSGLGREIQAPDGFAIDGAIQTDAALNHGNSGGPLLDARGRVIGMNSQIQSETGGNVGVGYAVPIETIKSVVTQLLASGQVRHAYLGVQLSDVENGGGALIVQVVEGTPAERAGILSGDVVTRAG